MAGNSEDFDKALKFALCCTGKEDFMHSSLLLQPQQKKVGKPPSEDTGTSNRTPMCLAQPCFFPLAVKIPNECFDCVSVRQKTDNGAIAT